KALEPGRPRPGGMEEPARGRASSRGGDEEGTRKARRHWSRGALAPGEWKNRPEGGPAPEEGKEN
ncbi:MAG: hypothetical protein WCI03_12520, partial [bacterium]